MGKVEARLDELGIKLPRPPKAVANYLCGVVQVGNIMYVSGTIGTIVDENDDDILPISGQMGDISLEDGYQSVHNAGGNQYRLRAS